MILRGKNEPELSLDDLLVMLFDEVEYVWPKLGYPPLVTPFSQYVKNVALMKPHAASKGRGALDDDRQPYVGHDFGQERTPARYFGARDSGTGQVQGF